MSRQALPDPIWLTTAIDTQAHERTSKASQSKLISTLIDPSNATHSVNRNASLTGCSHPVGWRSMGGWQWCRRLPQKAVFSPRRGAIETERAMRILILEDDPLLAFDLQCIVEECGHEVVTLCGSLEDLRSHLDDATDFAFLDVDLPDGKSYELAARLDERRVPFAFVSGSRRGDMPEHLRHAHFIPKPYSQNAIRKSLNCETRIAC
jgi:CheY-like chemotaxis protein